jgi:hypothetical protein
MQLKNLNGTTWTSSGSLNTARNSLAGAGTQTAALAFGGYTTNYWSYRILEWNNLDIC